MWGTNDFIFIFSLSFVPFSFFIDLCIKYYIIVASLLAPLSNSPLSPALQQVIDSSPADAATLILDATNRFFTIIPHDFGLNNPPLLDNKDVIVSKTQMLDSLMDMEIAYNLLKSDG